MRSITNVLAAPPADGDTEALAPGVAGRPHAPATSSAMAKTIEA